MLNSAYLPNLHRLILNFTRVIDNLSMSRTLRLILHSILVEYILKSTLIYVSSVSNIVIDLITLFETYIHSLISSIATI